jgi:hypothetical protein
MGDFEREKLNLVSFETEGRQSYGLWLDEKTWLEAPTDFLAKFPDLKSAMAADQLNDS